MRRIAALIMVFALLLGYTGCTTGKDDLNDSTQLATDQTDLNTSIDLPKELNAQNKYAFDGFFQEAEDFFCGKSMDAYYIQYYDKTTGIGGVLCADPACSHDGSECSAYTSISTPVLYYDRKLYRITSSSYRDYLLVESDLTGMNRRTVMEISYDNVFIPYQPQRFVLHQGKLYLVGRTSAVTGTEVGCRVSLLAFPLDGDEPFSVLYDESFPSGVQETARFIGKYIYFSVVTFQDSGPYGVTITRFDIQSGETKIVYQESGMAEIPGAVWVTDNHEIYLPGYTGEKAYLWKLENNTRTEIMTWDTGARPRVMENIIFGVSVENGIRFVDISDLSGNPIYSGRMFLNPIEGIDFDLNTCSLAFLGGDSEKLIIMLSDYTDTNVEYTVMLDLKNNLEATLLWSDTR